MGVDFGDHATHITRDSQVYRLMWSSTLLDELGYVPFDKAGAELLFSFISQRCERRSLVVMTNMPFARRSEVFLDATAAPAVIDRVVHHATVLTTAGDSYRLKDATRNQASRTPQEAPRQ